MAGVTVELAGPCSVHVLLRETLRLTDEDIARGARTVLVDGRPIDDLDTALRPGCRLALSGALPGLAGAALRSGSPLASLRGTISGPAEGGDTTPTAAGDSPAAPADGGPRPLRITMCLFNTALPAVGPALLAHGVVAERAQAAALVRRDDPDLPVAAGHPSRSPSHVRLRAAAGGRLLVEDGP